MSPFPEQIVLPMQSGSHPPRVHFLGICGTAMGAAAAAMRDRGYSVSGQDEKVYPPMSDYLAAKGIPITPGYDPTGLPPDADFIVVGNAISRGNPALEAVLNLKLLYFSLPETLKHFFLHGRHNLVVTGTHGKTTTTSMLAWILEYAGRSPGWLIGGVPANLPSSANLQDSRFFVIEGDEYDTAFFDKRSKFLHYLPELVIINNIEFDHADIYRDLDDVKMAFRRLVRIIPGEGMLLVNGDDANSLDVAREALSPVVEVGFSPNASHNITNPADHADGSSFELLGEHFVLPMVGEFNIRNAAMAVSAAHFYGIPLNTIREALGGFQGIRRRQEVRGVVRGVTVVDDFGHHPTAIRETLHGLRSRHPSSRIWAVFEPRSNTTRRRVFQNSLPAAFEPAHGVFLSQVARLDQIEEGERLDPGQVVRDLETAGKLAFYEPTADSIVDRLVPMVGKGDLIVVFSNGGFDGIHEKLLTALQ
ncbi:MAG: UDP-N-acetylmuramate:L-alanyl-gamma-D-glutamyl-me so-diaminopimelate ligase [Terrimicrobiaceae bacterium]